MDGIKIEVTGNVARCTAKPSKITAGTVGLPVEFTFDAEHWDGLSKTAVFLTGHMSKISERLDTEAIVPWELLEKPGAWLHIGVYGSNEDGTIVIPTIFASVGAIVPGANPGGDPSTDPTLPVWQEVIADIGDTDKLETDKKNNLVDAVNEVYNLAKAGGVKTDTTLSLEGSPADAAAVGEALANQSAAVEEALATHSESVDEALTNQAGQKTPNGGEIFNYYTDKVYTGDTPPKEFPGNTANKGAHAQNFGTHADGEYSSASGWNSTASGGIANATGRETVASGYASTTEGWLTKATSTTTHAGGKESEATNANAFAYGNKAKATGNTAFAIGEGTEASGFYAVASGYHTKASGTCSSSSGRDTEAQQYASSAQGRGTIATARNQSVRGAYNIPDAVDSNGNGDYAEIVGGGSNANSRSNIYTLDWNGNGWFSGKVTVGSNKEQLATINQTAPAGYGLGDNAQRIDSWNNAKRSGFYVSSYGGPDGDGNEWHGIVSNYNTALCNQLVWKSWGSGSIMVTRRILEGAPEAWEWVNPPMDAGVEYRTTERWNGQAVYTCLINCGEMANGASTIPVVVNNEPLPISRLVRYVVTGGRGQLPMWFGEDSNTYNCTATYDNKTLYIYNNGGYIGMSLYAQFWYVK